MQTSIPAPGWYADPEAPAYLRYWDGSGWTEHRAEPQENASAVQPLDGQPEDRSFTVVVVGVLLGAVLLIASMVTVKVWFDSYGNGTARGKEAAAHGIEPGSADEYCHHLASDVTASGSADGYWDLPWIMGCKRALG